MSNNTISLNCSSSCNGQLVCGGGSRLHAFFSNLRNFANRFVCRRQNTVGLDSQPLQRHILGIYDTLVEFLAHLRTRDTQNQNIKAIRRISRYNNESHDLPSQKARTIKRGVFGFPRNVMMWRVLCELTSTTFKNTITSIRCGDGKLFFSTDSESRNYRSIHAEKIFPKGE